MLQALSFKFLFSYHFSHKYNYKGLELHHLQHFNEFLKLLLKLQSKDYIFLIKNHIIFFILCKLVLCLFTTKLLPKIQLNFEISAF